MNLHFLWFYMAINISYEITLMYFAVKVICDHKSGKSKGYGFVQFSSEIAGGKALKDMDGKVNCKDEIYIQGESSTSINIKSIHVKVYLVF